MPRPPREPLSPEELKQIASLAGIGLNTEQIASVMGMSRETLKRRIKETDTEPIKNGRALALSNVGKTLYQMAVSGKNPAATFFYLKTRGGWREKDRVEVTGRDGGPVEGKISVTVKRLLPTK
jgi:malonyl CoA-acyl carrier protein transacylase